MTTDNRTNDSTPEQVEAAAKAIADCHNPGMFEKYPENWRVEARAALVAAQGASPQAAKDVHEPSHDRVYCVRCGGNWPCQPAPVQPSSTVDEGKWRDVAKSVIDRRPYSEETRREIRGLENAIARATRVPVQGEPSDGREMLKRIAEEASVRRLKDSIEEWRKAIGAAYGTFPDDWELEFWHAGYRHGANAMIEHQVSRATVPVQGEPNAELLDQVEMPGYNPDANVGRGDWGLRNVSDGSVTSHATDKVRCVDHGAMNSVSQSRDLWRCLQCGRAAYVPVQGEPNDELIEYALDYIENGTMRPERRKALQALAARATVPDAATGDRDALVRLIFDRLPVGMDENDIYNLADAILMVYPWRDAVNGLPVTDDEKLAAEYQELLQDSHKRYVKDTDELFMARKAVEAERDAALAVVERVRVLAYQHRSVEQHNEMVPMSDIADLIREPSSAEYLAALDGAPEPEEKP